MAGKNAFQKSKLFFSVAAHPYLSLAAVFFFVAGIASGISTNSGMERANSVASAAQWLKGTGSYDVAGGLLHAALFEFLLFTAAASAAAWKPLFALSCLSITAKGFFAGFSIQQLLYEYGGLGALYALLFVGLPMLLSGTALFLCFLWAGKTAFGRTVKKGETAGRAERSMDKAEGREFLRNALLLCMGILAEGIFIPFLFKLFSWQMSGV